MHRNKLPFLLLVFLSALMFVTGVIAAKRHWQHALLLKNGGQIAFGASIVLYFVVPDKHRDRR